ncbi:hypothetical protein ACWD4G_12225 [Streptomyces sp. NPDC002643]
MEPHALYAPYALNAPCVPYTLCAPYALCVVHAVLPGGSAMRRRSYRRPYRRVLARIMGAGVLMGATAACTMMEKDQPRGFPEAAVVESSASASPSARPTPALTDARARSALLRAGDLGDAWSGTESIATWRDGLLKGRTDPPECQPLLDAVYAEDVLGEPKGGTAVTGFDDDEYGAQLRYQVGAYDEAEVAARIDHFRELAQKCQEFTINGVGDREHYARITPVDLPDDLGETGQAVRLVVSGEVDGEEDGALTLDLATLRMGDTAALLTHGGLYGIDETATRDAARAGALRLRDALAEKQPEKKPKPKPTKEKEKPKKDEKKKPSGGEVTPSARNENDSSATRNEETRTDETGTSPNDQEEETPSGADEEGVSGQDEESEGEQDEYEEYEEYDEYDEYEE